MKSYWHISFYFVNKDKDGFGSLEYNLNEGLEFIPARVKQELRIELKLEHISIMSWIQLKPSQALEAITALQKD